MKTITFSATVVMLLTASATTLLANGPMGTTSSSSSSNSGSRSTGTGRTRPRPMPSGYNGRGVTNCYDYAYACGAGTPSGPMKGPDDLRNHSSVRSRNTYNNPMDARGQYRPGDWLITVGHAGYVNTRGGIDHYHMFSNGNEYRSGQRYLNPNDLPVEGPDGMGGLRTNDSLENFLHSGDRYHPYRTGPMGGVTVLRRR